MEIFCVLLRSNEQRISIQNAIYHKKCRKVRVKRPNQKTRSKLNYRLWNCVKNN